jgi:tripartite-type tricarboxylate transporter receptor subunit TctC
MQDPLSAARPIAALAPVAGIHRRGFIGGVLGAAALAAGTAHAQERTIALMVGYPPGGATDLLARILADGLGHALDTSILVENKPGAGGRIATEYVKNAKPDGATLLFSISAPMVIYPHIYQKLGYDPLKDFVPVGAAARQMLCLAVGPQVPGSVRTLADYVAWVKANPRLAMFGTVSGTAPHFAGLLFAQAAGLKLELAPYKGGAQAVVDLMGGHLPATVTPVSEVQPYQAAGRLRILATMGPQRPSILPDVPTMIELGYKDISFQTWLGIFAPAGTPSVEVTRFNAALNRVLAQPEVVERIGKLGMEPAITTLAQFGQIVQDDLALYGKSVAITGFKAED